MNLTNQEIFNYALTLQSNFSLSSENVRFIKASVNFYLQKNINILTKLGLEIEKTRDQIFSNYGTKGADGSWQIPPESIPLVEQEINSLMKLQQTVHIYKINLSEIADIDFSVKEMQALMFMIEDDLCREEG